uniref:Uncharacterized protein n=1 Tax=Anopheles albimanus TaxID=7167 RepID=A0A182FXP5_ANOAL
MSWLTRNVSTVAALARVRGFFFGWPPSESAANRARCGIDAMVLVLCCDVL